MSERPHSQGKKNAGANKRTQAPKTGGRSQYTPEQLEFRQQLGLAEEDGRTAGELLQMQREYNPRNFFNDSNIVNGYKMDALTASKRMGPKPQQKPRAEPANQVEEEAPEMVEMQCDSCGKTMDMPPDEGADEGGDDGSGPKVQRKCAACEDKAETPELQTAPASIQMKAEETKTTTETATTTEGETETETTPAGWIVEDGETVGEGQMAKSVFLAVLQAQVCTTVDAALAGLPFSSSSCPYIAKAFNKHKRSTPDRLQSVIVRYAPEATEATSAQGLLAAVVRKAGNAARKWARTGDTSGLPPELAANLPPAAKALGRFNRIFSAVGSMGGRVASAAKSVGRTLANAASSAVSTVKSWFWKARPGGPNPEGAASNNQSALDRGQSLPSDTRTKMEASMGEDFSNVRLHTGTPGAQLSDSMNARAFTAGDDIAFGSGEYQPGTPVGDALIAHELAHVKQQRSGASGSHSTAQLEQNADEMAVQAMLDPEGEVAEKPAAKRAGLKLMRCGDDPPEPVYFDAIHTEFHGDPFRIDLTWYPGAEESSPGKLGVNIIYTGNGQPNKAGYDLELAFDEAYGIPNPKVVSDEDNVVTIDLFGQSGHSFTIFSRNFEKLDNWDPPAHKHWIYMRYSTGSKIRSTFEPDIIIKQPEALPSDQVDPDAELPKIEQAPGVPTYDPAVGLPIMIAKMKSFIKDPLLENSQVAFLNPLLNQLEKDLEVAQDSATAQTKLDDISKHTRDLEDTFASCSKIVKNLGTMMNKDGYLGDIADEAVGYVDDVQQKFIISIFMSYADRAMAQEYYDQGNALLPSLPHKISALYLNEDGGVEKLLNQTLTLRQSLQYFRLKNGRGAITRPIDSYLQFDKAGLKSVVPSDKDADLMQQLDAARKGFFAGNDPNVAQKIQSLTEQSQRAVGVYGLVNLYEQFYWYAEELDHIVDDVAGAFGTEYEDIAIGYKKKFRALIDRAEPALAPDVDEATMTSTLDAVLADFDAIVTSKKFSEDVEGINDRLEAIEVTEFVGKVVVIVAAAALTAGAAGAAVGAALEGAGVGGLLAAGAVTFTEALAFTFVSRIGNDLLLGGNETSFGEDLATNFVMFAFLKAIGSLYAKLMARMKINPKSMKFKVGQFGTSFAALQAFAVGHHYIKKGEMMTAKEFWGSLGMNAVLMTTLHLGRFIMEPLNARISTQVREAMMKRFNTQVTALNAERAAISEMIAKLEKPGVKPSESELTETLGRIRSLYEKEMALIEKAAKAEGLTGKAMAESMARYRDAIVEADGILSKPVTDAQSPTRDFFRPVKNDTVAYKDGKATEVKDILENFYKEVNGEYTVAENGIITGRAGVETLIFVPESIAAKGGLATWAGTRGTTPAESIAFIRARISEKAREGLDKLIEAKDGKEKDALEWLKEKEAKGEDIQKALEVYEKPAPPIPDIDYTAKLEGNFERDIQAWKSGKWADTEMPAILEKMYAELSEGTPIQRKAAYDRAFEFLNLMRFFKNLKWTKYYKSRMKPMNQKVQEAVNPESVPAEMEPWLIDRTAKLKEMRAQIPEENLLIEQGTRRKQFETTRDIQPRDMSEDPRTSLSIGEIHMMQASVSNPTGDYFVLQNGITFKNNPALFESLPRIRVWVNEADGKIWTLDHRRLAAAKLAGFERVTIEWASQGEVMGEFWKMTTTGSGLDIKIRVPLDAEGNFVKKGPDLKVWDLKHQSDGSYKVLDETGKQVTFEDIQSKIKPPD